MTTVSNFEVTLIYKDATTWFAGSFPSNEAAEKWIAEERTRPYWDAATQAQIIDKTQAS